MITNFYKLLILILKSLNLSESIDLFNMRTTRNSRKKPIEQQPSLDFGSDDSDSTFVGEEYTPQPSGGNCGKVSKCPSLELSEFDLEGFSCSYDK